MKCDSCDVSCGNEWCCTKDEKLARVELRSDRFLLEVVKQELEIGEDVSFDKGFYEACCSKNVVIKELEKEIARLKELVMRYVLDGNSNYGEQL